MKVSLIQKLLRIGLGFVPANCKRTCVAQHIIPFLPWRASFNRSEFWLAHNGNELALSKSGQRQRAMAGLRLHASHGRRPCGEGAATTVQSVPRGRENT